jgi:uncharacterized membrane protein
VQIWYKVILLVGMFTLPFIIILIGNKFDRSIHTLCRYLCAALAVWAYLLMARFIVVFVDVKLVESPEQLQEIYDGDGAKNAFVLIFGWAIGLMVATFSWLFARLCLWLKHRKNVTTTSSLQ